MLEGDFTLIEQEQILSKFETVWFKDSKDSYDIIMGILVSYVPWLVQKKKDFYFEK